jgi:hypothetical protein
VRRSNATLTKFFSVDCYDLKLLASSSPDLHALNCKNCSQMVNWILVGLENDNFLDLVFGFFK